MENQAETALKISLKAARVNAGLTLVEASKALGVAIGTLVKWESNSGLVTPIKQRAISELYSIPVNNIFFEPN
ncbi:helix-turn-helix transcriptional regulator [Culicoidibacter larvae]|uniref:Helix-turn-helix transcriptional regulator n=1 Tax=Culicoidibacter larvae TaxID=2579976 RepID=A0A5R8Q7I4_9FIRM|nr:helix-turn-helix transcriptional regulator [Culicoidibacter larvae]TLG71407.1 helix-turn-helix transcriptional regulator [Culicoidibacter larvae]